MMLAAMRGLLPYHQAVVDGSWRQDGRFCLNELPILDLRGKTLGIVGIGNIGKRVTEIARVFGMNVLWAERRHATPRRAHRNTRRLTKSLPQPTSLACIARSTTPPTTCTNKTPASCATSRR